MTPTIGILGAGKLGIVLAQLFTKAGYKVLIAGSGDPQKIALPIKILAPGAIVQTKEAAAEKSDVIILALPLGKYRTIPKQALAGKLVIDAMNYWWEVDGDRPEFTSDEISTSEIVQGYLTDSRVVKAISHVGYHELFDENRPEGAPDRKAIAIAGDVKSDVDTVAMLINSIGFTPVPIGVLSEGRKLQPGGALFGRLVDAQTLPSLVIETTSKPQR
jgi:8-hydroxy-5-deazaflavin:NADPH oxidoreductase